jgi:hypothetical protein
VDVFGPATVGATPFIESEGVSGVTSTSATLEASIDPTGIQTSYSFEYAANGGSFTRVGPNAIGASETPQHVEAPLQGLTPSTTYNRRARHRTECPSDVHD